MIFYPAIIGWTLFGTWLANIIIRTKRLEEKQLEELELQLSE
jgi:heme exporter protein C